MMFYYSNAHMKTFTASHSILHSGTATAEAMAIGLQHFDMAGYAG
jgi:hypothetical protein